MRKKQDTPPDDLSPRIPDIVAEIIRHFRGLQREHIAGYAIIVSDPFTPPIAFRVIGDDNGHRLSYETIETDDRVFITARLPSDRKNQPCVEIMKDGVRIFIDERVATIPLKFTVDVIRSHFSVRNGVLDITLTKLNRSGEIHCA